MNNHAEYSSQNTQKAHSQLAQHRMESAMSQLDEGGISFYDKASF
jgi:hypothetical protein